MNYFQYIEKDNRTIEELKEFFLNEYPKYYEIWRKGYWETKFTGVGMAVALYLTGYIHEYRPKSIVEYGSGMTTLLMSTILEDLNYGGSISTFEDDHKYYSLGESTGLYSKMNGKNKIELTPVVVSDKKQCYYDHNINKIDSVDFVLDDGPNINKYNCDASINMIMLQEHFKKPFSFLIDGRIRQQKFYQSKYGDKVKQSWIGIDKKTNFLREDGYKCGIGTI